MTENACAVQRRSPRFTTRFTVILVTKKGDDRAETPAQVVEFSAFGLVITSQALLVPEQQVDIVPQEGPEHIVGCRVVWVRKIEGDLGIRAALELLKPIVQLEPP